MVEDSDDLCFRCGEPAIGRTAILMDTKDSRAEGEDEKQTQRLTAFRANSHGLPLFRSPSQETNDPNNEE